MPHQCTTCGNVFPDGSKEMLSGCPGCGGNKFQFHAGGVPEDAEPDGTGSPSPPDGPADGSHVASAVGKAAGTLRNFVADRGRPSTPDPDSLDRPSGGPGAETGIGADAEAGDSTETTQATLDALADDGTDSTDADGAMAPADPTEPEDAPDPDADDVSARWPSVGTEDGVEATHEDDAAGPGEWPDPWEHDEGVAADDGVGSGAADASDGSDIRIADESEWREQKGVESVATEPGTGRETVDDQGDADTGTVDDQGDADTRTVDAGTDAGAVDDGRDAETVRAGIAGEDHAQADARSSMVGSDELPDGPTDGRVVGEPSEEERPDLAELRQELNDQFESIKVVAPGQYELNLMELYDREEYIIAIQENGKYVIDVPDTPDAPMDASE